MTLVPGAQTFGRGPSVRAAFPDRRRPVSPVSPLANARELFGGRLGMWLGDWLDGSVVIYIGIDALFQ
jgi:hypothetical protein